MTISPQTFATSDHDWTSPLSVEQKGYRRAVTQHAVQNMLLDRYASLSDAGVLSKAALARRLGAHPSQITKWLSFPRNLTIDTISDLLLAMNARLEVRAAGLDEPKADLERSNNPQTTTGGRVEFTRPLPDEIAA